ncbi:F0F1 ATP synthase subunit gamma [Streptococcus hyovaginalis]
MGSYNPLLTSAPIKRTGYIFITFDKGLVGGYNATILKSMMYIINEYHSNDRDFEIIALGAIGADFFKARGFYVAFDLRGLSDQARFEEVAQRILEPVGKFKTDLFYEF